MTTTTTTPERRETDAERIEREEREVAEALAARAAEVAALSDEQLCRDATDAELRAERDRLAAAGVPRTRGILTVPRPLARERLARAREALAGAAAGAITAAARECARPEGPSTDSLRRALALRALAGAPGGFWTDLAAAIDGPAPSGMSELFTDDDPAAELRAAARGHDVRRNRISDELEARAIAATAVAKPGMAERIAALTGRRKEGKS
jgi:hypothetical protein